ncbi:MAG: gamma-glutamylcyclotransferase [Mangrovicoccus sp.]|nr:gamma-glutamylcyclotransferase [Mangrovicoccus sp.]
MGEQDKDIALWVFGYGSLMWHPGFEPVERQLAKLSGWHRSFCMWSIHHRGTEAAPGLVLALDAQETAQCNGVAFGVGAAQQDQVLAELRARELISSAYLERHLPIRLADGREVEAVTYVIDPTHVQYCADMPLERQAQVIAQAHGDRGPNDAYLYNTVTHLHELALPDPDLDWLAARVRRIKSGESQ